MNANDPRHGTYAGYVAHTKDGDGHCEPCRSAARRYQAGRKWDQHTGSPRSVSALPTRRRLEALMALGWDMKSLAPLIGAAPQMIHRWRIIESIYRHNHDRVARVYDQLSMRLPPTDTTAQKNTVTRIKSLATRNGYAPPLAWDNIDDPNETPKTTGTRRPQHTLAEYRFLIEAGESHHAAITKLGITDKGLERAIYREKEAA